MPPTCWPAWRSPLAAVAALALLALAACSAPTVPADLARAERHRQAGEEDAALVAYDAAIASCRKLRPKPRRQQVCAQAMAGRAEVLVELGRPDDAADAWEAMATELADAPDAASRALHEAGAARLGLGQEKAAYDLFWRNILAYPDATHAEESLRLIVRDGRRRSPTQLDGVLAQIYPHIQGSELADNLLYARADLHEHELEDPVGAIALYDQIIAAYPKAALYDDALWHAARLSRAAGDAKGALARLRKLLATREVAVMVGSYFSVWLDDAQLEAARILRDDLGRPRDAAALLEQLPKHYPDSTLRDDALYELAVTRQQLGDGAGACRALAALHDKYPESRWELEEAPARRDALGCKLPGPK